MSDPIADMLTRIRNGQSAYLRNVACPHSKHKEDVLSILKSEGYIVSYIVSDLKNNKKTIDISLKYSAKGKPAIQEIKKVSKPGRRVYKSISELKPVYNNLGIYIISTPSGVIADHTAREKGVGGEVICQVF